MLYINNMINKDEINIINTDIKNKYEDKKIKYCFTINNYKLKFSYDKIYLNLHVFKMRPKFKKYDDYMSYENLFYIVPFSDDDEIYIILKNDVIKNLILYCSDTAEETFLLGKNICKNKLLINAS
jgi:hypothetical protein